MISLVVGCFTVPRSEKVCFGAWLKCVCLCNARPAVAVGKLVGPEFKSRGPHDFDADGDPFLCLTEATYVAELGIERIHGISLIIIINQMRGNKRKRERCRKRVSRFI